MMAQMLPKQTASGRRSAKHQKTRLTVTEYKREVAKRTLENEVQRDVCAYLRACRIPFSITNAEATFNANGHPVKRVETGWSDLTACENGALNSAFAGKLLAIENKRAVGGELSYDQAVTLFSIHQSKGLICIARSIDDVIEVRTHGTRQVDLQEIAQAIRTGPPKPKLKPRRNNL